jgi:hypothetical protein
MYASSIYVSDKEDLMLVIAEDYDYYKDKIFKFEIKPLIKSKIDISVLFSNIELNIKKYNKKQGVFYLEFSEPVSLLVLDKLFNYYIPLISIKN